ncbi:MAG: PadR family transcriptional regulator [Acidobacteriia bacterium]|nr:PadR family transcriptional regulator [Terriglobia bacterium]
MGSQRSDLLQGTLDLLVLKTLDSIGPMHGYAIARRLQQASHDFLQVNQGSLYPALLRLGRRGWVTSKWGVTENNRKAKYYSVTKAGKKQLQREAECWDRMASVIYKVLQGT